MNVLVLLTQGQSNKDIAANLAIAEATVNAHTTAILRTLGLERRTQPAILAQRLLQTTNRPGIQGSDEEAQ